MTPLFTAPQEMFFVILTLVLFAALVGDFSNARLFRAFRNRPSPWKDLAKDARILFLALAAFMAWAQDKDSLRSSGNGDWLSGSTLEFMEGGYYTSMTEGDSSGITWAVLSGLPPFTSNAVLTSSQYLGGFACVIVTNIQPAALDAPAAAVAFTNWPYAVARQSVLLPQGCLPEGFTFGGRAVTNLYAAASGMLSFDGPKSSPVPATNGIPDGTAANYISVLQTPSDIVPTNGVFWYAPGTNSSVFTWKDVYLGHDTNCLATVQAELYANGDFTCRYHFPSATNYYAQLTNAFLIGAQNNSGGETVLYTNALLAINDSFFPAFELRWKSLAGLSLNDADPDGDGITTADELFIYRTDPRNRDSDGDGLTDGEEVSQYGTNPNAFSSDASGQGDLWRILSGLGPSDAPYTNAAPSASVGILTVMTVLENAPTNGAAVLRIANQYIPVLAGTTLVSRIAIPRGATNLFILARGVNCDSAIAQITLEASYFTKIRDTAGVFSAPFTLSPSYVTASGTILMPAYTITPEVFCLHSPTSSVCRITSADPDVYFSTEQGLVREYTPDLPGLPETFTNGLVQLTLASMDTTLFVLAASTNIPAHYCNLNGQSTDEYPNGTTYRYWCKFENGSHVYADGYDATNCPCLAITNAYQCPCSGIGVDPCPCNHAMRDPKAMPLNADQTNVLGHAVLKINGTNDLLDVTVPEGSYKPCPLCACASGVPSSADVYRQTSCISATPGSLMANGAFSVAGLHPSTNFADTVFMYRLTDYSGAQTVTSYTRKDYTVLGTSVYPTDTGHSVSNWFIGCGITNALTLWTGVKLPADTGEVTLSVSIDSGTPTPQLYVYNRVAQSNELLVTHDQLTFTQNLGDWRDTYCDTNGYAQAYLLCASGGVVRVTHSYDTYSGQPYALSCDAEQKLTAWALNINPKGRVVFTGSTTNILFSLEPGSWTNCVWTISSSASMLADGPVSAPVYSFYVGTNVWVNPGTLATNYTVTCSAVGVPELNASAGFVVSREIAWTPTGDSVYVWEPINDGNFPSEFVKDLCKSEFYQGWSYSKTNPVTWFSDSDPEDDDCETCTLANLKAMTNGGVVAILTHGTNGVLEVARFASEAAANAWRGTEPDMYVTARSNSASVFATSAWFQNNWMSSLKQNNAIVFISACHSADGYDSIASSVGGRTVLAEHGAQDGYITDEAFGMIIDRMKGKEVLHRPNGRSAAKAFAAVSQQPNLQGIFGIWGDGLSTLCPAPQTVYPISSQEKMAGWGCILFDTYMDNSVSAGTAVVPQTGTTSSRFWGGSITNSFYIDFLHSGSGVSVEALGDKCRSSGQQGRPMDGDGVAPMPVDGQSKEWSW